MRTSCVLMLALVLIGCDGKKEVAPQPPADNNKSAPTGDPAPKSDVAATPDNKTPTPADPTPTPTPPQPSVGWTDNLQEMRCPERAVAGRMMGQAFTPQSAELSRIRGRFLSLRQGEEYSPDFEVKILLSGAKEDNFTGKTIEIAPDAGPDVPAVSLLWKPQGRETESKQIEGKYALRLEFGQESEGLLPGKIYLCLPDEAKSYVAGTFRAVVEPDYAKAPQPEEFPCIVGRIALAGKESLSVVTGVIGLTEDGKRVTNLTGTIIAPDVETSVSSVDTPPQRSSLVHDAQAGCQCRHARLAPGRYLVFVGSGDRYIDWRWVEVKEKTTITLDFALDPKQAGALEVMLPKDAKDEVHLVPLDENGKVPDIKEAMSGLSLAMKTDVTPKAGKVVLDGLRPGRYRVSAGGVEKDVIVKVNETVKADLSAP